MVIVEELNMKPMATPKDNCGLNVMDKKGTFGEIRKISGLYFKTTSDGTLKPCNIGHEFCVLESEL
jgi:hypothetical protein